jgi:ABC-type polysaccharide/polyol phosphate transport system ATPase subunit
MKKANNSAIKLINISKKYTIHHEKPTLVEHLIKTRKETFYALKNINLEIKKGEKVGIFGPNGSGKTTLLKIIAGITAPTQGEVNTNGRIVSLIDLEAGFHPDLTGEQNIYLNGMLLGMKKNEIGQKIHQIIEFADIKQFIDTPLFTYSSGMKLRLGFSVAVHAGPDILILDEGIAVGDENFQRKSQAKIQEFFKKGKTIIVVTQWLNFIKKNCNKVIKIQNGKVENFGGIELIKEY